MSSFKWSLFFILVIFPLFLLLGDFMAHTTAVDDADTATRDAAQAAIKANIVKNSLRDADVYPDNIVIKYNPDTIQTVFNQSFTRNVQTSQAKTKPTLPLRKGRGLPGRKSTRYRDRFPRVFPVSKLGGEDSVLPW